MKITCQFIWPIWTRTVTPEKKGDSSWGYDVLWSETRVWLGSHDIAKVCHLHFFIYSTKEGGIHPPSPTPLFISPTTNGDHLSQAVRKSIWDWDVFIRALMSPSTWRSYSPLRMPDCHLEIDDSVSSGDILIEIARRWYLHFLDSWIILHRFIYHRWKAKGVFWHL